MLTIGEETHVGIKNTNDIERKPAIPNKTATYYYKLNFLAVNFVIIINLM
jgi:hypothetical protein